MQHDQVNSDKVKAALDKYAKRCIHSGDFKLYSYKVKNFVKQLQADETLNELERLVVATTIGGTFYRMSQPMKDYAIEDLTKPMLN